MLSHTGETVLLEDEAEQLNALVRRVFYIEDVTTGSPKQGFLVRYRGRLVGDSVQAYDQLAAALRPLNITPLFRKEKDRQVILLMDGVVQIKASNPWINLLLFVLTFASVTFIGGVSSSQGLQIGSLEEMVISLPAVLWAGLPFSVSLLAILGAHEFGHYLAGRYHGTAVTLPYFLPLPLPGLSPFGTLGAFIQMKEPPKNKRILLDIGVAGPLAGFAVALPVLLIGLTLSRVEPIRILPGQAMQMEGNSIVYLLAKFIVFGRLLPAPLTYGGLPPLLYWLRYFFTGQPIPLGGLDVMIHPVAWAGWGGMLVTALNLVPAGQLDGGHLLYVLLGRRARNLLPFLLGILVALSFVWLGWLLWAFLVFVLGRMHAEPLDQITPLDPARKAVAILGLILFILVFIPVPLTFISTGAAF